MGFKKACQQGALPRGLESNGGREPRHLLPQRVCTARAPPPTSWSSWQQANACRKQCNTHVMTAGRCCRALSPLPYLFPGVQTPRNPCCAGFRTTSGQLRVDYSSVPFGIDLLEPASQMRNIQTINAQPARREGIEPCAQWIGMGRHVQILRDGCIPGHSSPLPGGGGGVVAWDPPPDPPTHPLTHPPTHPPTHPQQNIFSQGKK